MDDIRIYLLTEQEILGHLADDVGRIGRKARCRFASLVARFGVATEVSSDDQIRCFGGPAPL